MAYGGQTLALDVTDPNSPEYLQAQQNLADTRIMSPLKAQAEQAAIAGQNLANQRSTLQNQQAQAAEDAQQAYESALGAGTPPPAAASPLAAAAAPPPVAPAAFFSPEVDKVITSIDPNDPKAAEKWDAAMKPLAERGVEGAAQFVGRWKKDTHAILQGDIADVQAANAVRPPDGSAPDAPAAPAAPGQSPLVAGATADGAAASPLAAQAPAVVSQPAASPISAADAAYQKWAIRDPKAAQDARDALAKAEYARTNDPSALKIDPTLFYQVAEAKTNMDADQRANVKFQYDSMGQGANALLMAAARAPGGANNPQVIQMRNQTAQEWAQRGWITPQQAQQEMQGPVNVLQLASLAGRAQTVTEALTTSGVAAGNEARARAPYQPDQAQYIGTDSDNHPLILDRRTAAVTTAGNTTIQAKPSATANLFETKKSAWLSLHPTDMQGALEFANGKRSMDPGQMQEAAAAQAARDLQAASMAGQTITDASGYLQAQTQAHLAAMQGTAPPAAAPAAAPGPQGAGVKPSAPAPTSVAYLKAHPNTAALFDQRYGVGAAKRILGR